MKRKHEQLTFFDTAQYDRINPLLQLPLDEIDPRELLNYFPRELKKLCIKLNISFSGGREAIARRVAHEKDVRQEAKCQRDMVQKIQFTQNIVNLDMDIVRKLNLDNLRFVAIKFKVSDSGTAYGIISRLERKQKSAQRKAWGTIK